MTCKPCRSDADLRLPVVQLTVTGTRRIGAPMRRAQALHASTFLIDQDGGFSSYDFPERLSEFGYLVRATDISLEDYEAPRPSFAQKGTLIGGNGKSLQSCDKCACRHRRGLARGRRQGQVSGC